MILFISALVRPPSVEEVQLPKSRQSTPQRRRFGLLALFKPTPLSFYAAEEYLWPRHLNKLREHIKGRHDQTRATESWSRFQNGVMIIDILEVFWVAHLRQKETVPKLVAQLVYLRFAHEEPILFSDMRRN